MIPLSISVHREGDNPVFGETVTIVTLDDEAGGPFIRLEQIHDSIEPGKLILDLEELELCLKAARKLLKGYEDEK